MPEFALIGDHNTYTDWGLALYDAVVGTPKVKTHYLDLPLENGVIDLSEAVTGRPSYGTREIRLYLGKKDNSPKGWMAVSSEVIRAIHGKKLKITLSFDSDYYYMGRVSCEEIEKISYRRSTFLLTATCEPYKYAHALSAAEIISDGTQSGTITNAGDQIVCPVLTATAAGMTVAVNGGAAYSIPAANTGTVIPELLLLPGANTVAIAGTGTLSVSWREGRL